MCNLNYQRNEAAVLINGVYVPIISVDAARKQMVPKSVQEITVN